jgi:lipoprotein LpqH
MAMVVDGNALSVSNNMGVKVGSANVSVDGKTYTITGQAQGADMKNPMAGMITKDFNIKVTCG